MKVKDLMKTDEMFVYGGNNIRQTAELMERKNHGMVVVLKDQESREVVGVLTNKDIVNRVIAKKKDPETTFVKDVMTREFLSIGPDKTTADAMILMKKHDIKRLVVMENGMVQGILHNNDIIGGMLQYKKNLLDMALDF